MRRTVGKVAVAHPLSNLDLTRLVEIYHMKQTRLGGDEGWKIKQTDVSVHE